MNFVSISDVHIKTDNDLSAVSFRKFLNHPKTYSADVVILLGDIFDFLVGGHHQYIDKFKVTIQAIIELSKSKKIIYIEGNHDFHLKNLVQLMLKEGLYLPNFELHRSYTVIKDGVDIYLGHGDELEIDNYGHRAFKAFVGNKFMASIAKYIPYNLLNTTGENASGASRRLNDYSYTEEEAERIKIKYHGYAKTISDKLSVSKVVCGHSHVKDLFKLENLTYINNGYFPKSKCFISYESGQFQFIEIS
jgi:UDP-2,3-diacylglucosamine hydrolase